MNKTQTVTLQIGRRKALVPAVLEVDVNTDAGATGLPISLLIQIPRSRSITVRAHFWRPYPKSMMALASMHGPQPEKMFGPLTVQVLGPRGGLHWKYQAPLVMVAGISIDGEAGVSMDEGECLALEFRVIHKRRSPHPEGLFTFTRQYLRWIEHHPEGVRRWRRRGK